MRRYKLTCRVSAFVFFMHLLVVGPLVYQAVFGPHRLPTVASRMGMCVPPLFWGAFLVHSLWPRRVLRKEAVVTEISALENGGVQIGTAEGDIFVMPPRMARMAPPHELLDHRLIIGYVKPDPDDLDKRPEVVDFHINAAVKRTAPTDSEAPQILQQEVTVSEITVLDNGGSQLRTTSGEVFLLSPNMTERMAEEALAFLQDCRLILDYVRPRAGASGRPVRVVDFEIGTEVTQTAC